MILRGAARLIHAVIGFYSRVVFTVLTTAVYQGFVIAEIFLNSYSALRPRYLNRHFDTISRSYSRCADTVVMWIAGKTAMLNTVSRWILHTAVAFVGIFVAPITHLVSIRRTRLCPPPTNPVLFHSAARLAAMIQERKITSEEVVTAYVERCREVNPYLNAIVETRYEVALREARNIDRMLAASPDRSAKHLAEEYPLLGVPITVKESIAVEGMSNDSACVRSSRQPAQKDATTVRLARAAGAIPIAVTNTPQLCKNWETYNYVTGLTMNPYEQKRTVGGSSGGEVALLAAGASVIGIGSDIAGSLRLPAMFTGVYGHKPTPHTVSTEGHNPDSSDPEWDDYFALGPLTRYAEDLPLMLRVLNDDSRAQLRLDKEVEIRKLRLCYIASDTSGVADSAGPEMRAAMDRVREHFKKTHNIEVEEIKIQNAEHIWEISSRVLLGLKGVYNIYTDPEDRDKMVSVWPELLRKMFGLSDSIFTCVMYGPVVKLNEKMPKRQVEKMKKMMEDIRSQFREVLKGDCVMFYPTYPNQAHIHYQVFYRFLNLSYLTIFNMLGLPVTQCPLGLTNGLPIGLQVVADKYNDHLTIAVAQELERAFGGWVPPNKDMVSNGKCTV